MAARKAKLTRDITAYRLTMDQMTSGGWTEKEIRSEYTRLRDITQKRLIRMAKSGETDNMLYERFGTVEKVNPKTGKTRLAGGVPEAAGKKTSELLMDMQMMAYAIGSSKKASVRDIRETRKAEKKGILDAIESRKKLDAAKRQKVIIQKETQEAEASTQGAAAPLEPEDEEEEDVEATMQDIRTTLNTMSNANWQRFGAVMKMLQPMVKSKQISSSGIITQAFEMVNDEPTKSPAEIFMAISSDLVDSDDDWQGILATLNRYDAQGNLMPGSRIRGSKKG